MNKQPTLQSLETRLRQAQKDTVVAMEHRGKRHSFAMDAPPPPEVAAEELAARGQWPPASNAFRDLEEWVKVHWESTRTTKPPAGTVAVLHPGPGNEEQLNASSAARKLVAAAAVHGADAVVRCAIGFASHGLREVRIIYLLKGPSILGAKALDEHCRLIPYAAALQQVNPAAAYEREMRPSPATANVGALECTYFEQPTSGEVECARYTSPLLKAGPETLALVLGLVWRVGLRVFAQWPAYPDLATATLPFNFRSWPGNSFDLRVELAVQERRPTIETRPIATEELARLMARYASQPDESRRRLSLAMRRVRDSTERTEVEDSVVDVCIALETLFIKTRSEPKSKSISKRGSWYFADSAAERVRVCKFLKEFYDLRSKIVHGAPPAAQTARQEAQEERRRGELIVDALDVARTSLKDMIDQGIPNDWEASEEPSSIRRCPPRNDSQIRSIKSDSFSWSLAEQKDIDRQLEAVWRRLVDAAEPPSPTTGATVYGNLHPKGLAECRQQGVDYVIMHPALLYMAHPKWPKAASDSLDERARYYCWMDVERHLERWRKAATAKRLTQFRVPHSDSAAYHPSQRATWPRPLE